MISSVAYVGINVPGGGLAEGNTVDNFCLLADDCGGIYAGWGGQSGITIRDNIISTATAYMPGKATSVSAYPVAAVYLDNDAHITFEELAAAGVDASPRRLLPSTLAKWIDAALGTPLLSGTLAEFTAQQTWTSSGTVSLLAGVACPSPSESGVCSLFNSSSLGNGQLSSARFPVNAGQFYKVHVQVRSGDAVPWTGTANARRNGPTYENIDVFNLNSPFRIAPSGWAAYDFYFQTVPANSHLLIGNLTVTPATVLPRDANSVTRLFVNRDYAASASASCPAASTCSLWRNLAYGSVSFPFQLPARQVQALWNASAVPPFPAPAAPRGLKSSR